MWSPLRNPSGIIDEQGKIYARGTQDMKSVGMQYLEAIRKLLASGFGPVRSVYVSFVPDEEIGGFDGVGKFVESEIFKTLNIGIELDEGLPSPTDSYIVLNGERIPWSLKIKAIGQPGHGAKLYDDSGVEHLTKSIESIVRFRASQFDQLKAGFKAQGEVISQEVPIPPPMVFTTRLVRIKILTKDFTRKENKNRKYHNLLKSVTCHL